MNNSNLLDILWTSNSPTSPSGYGCQTKLFVPRIKASGYGAAIAANYGVQGAPYQTADGTLVLPSVVDSALNDVIYGYYQFTKSDLVISLYDPHAYNPDIFKQFAWCAWCPIDSSPLLPANKHALQATKYIWAMSRHGEQMLHDAGFTNVTYVPHGFDTKIFVPKNREETRRSINGKLSVDITGKFLVVANSANKGTPSRKGFYEMLSAFKAFSDAHSDALLYLHTEQNGAFAGENIPAIMAMLKLEPSKVLFPPQFQLVTGMLPDDWVADMYNTADVFLSTSHGEGFGCPIVEAQLCGCPVIVTDCSAMTELCMTGSLIPATAYMPVVGTTWKRPDIPATVQALEYAYTHWRDNVTIRQEARDKALIYDVNKVYDGYMKPAIEAMQADLYHPTEPQKILKKRIYTSQPEPLLAGRY